MRWTRRLLWAMGEMLLLGAASRLAVRAAVVAKGLSNDRLFLGDPKLHVSGRETRPGRRKSN